MFLPYPVHFLNSLIYFYAPHVSLLFFLFKYMLSICFLFCCVSFFHNSSSTIYPLPTIYVQLSKPINWPVPSAISIWFPSHFSFLAFCSYLIVINKSLIITKICLVLLLNEITLRNILLTEFMDQTFILATFSSRFIIWPNLQAKADLTEIGSWASLQ